MNRITPRWPWNPVERREAAAQTIQFVDAIGRVFGYGCTKGYGPPGRDDYDLGTIREVELQDMYSRAAFIVEVDCR